MVKVTNESVMIWLEAEALFHGTWFGIFRNGGATLGLEEDELVDGCVATLSVDGLGFDVDLNLKWF